MPISVLAVQVAHIIAAACTITGVEKLCFKVADAADGIVPVRSLHP
jgi:hypothetical protein